MPMRLFLVCFACSFLNFTVARADDRLIYLYDFHVHENSDFWEKTIKEMGTEEFSNLAIVACAIFEVNCREEAAAIAAGARKLSDDYVSRGENHYITGIITKHDDDGEDWYGNFTEIAGHDVCRAALDYGNMGISGGSTFNVGIERKSDHSFLRFYAVIPKNTGKGEGVDAQLAVEYVPRGTAEAHGCSDAESYPWLCKGQECSPLSRM